MLLCTGLNFADGGGRKEMEDEEVDDIIKELDLYDI